MNKFTLNITDIQPSQLYINKDKLKKVEDTFAKNGREELEPLPVKTINGVTFLTDGHTRAYVLYKNGIKDINLFQDEETLGGKTYWMVYLICINWCQKNKIYNITDLDDRIIDDKQYQKLWLDRCKKLQNKLSDNPLYNLEIEKIRDSRKKSEICETILRSLPEWFEIEEAINNYINTVKDKMMIAAKVGNITFGFISTKENSQYSSEIYVMGILKEVHRLGIGSQLLSTVEDRLRKENKKFLTVKTLSASHPDKNYEKTRKFYKASGFYPLEEFETLWGENNPCLYLVKILK